MVPPDAPADTPIEGAGGVVFDPHERVLLIRHRNGAWVFPKGHLDPGEDHLTAAVREVEEEAGVSCDCPRPDEVWRTEYTNARGEPRRVTWFRLRSDATEADMREALFPEGAFLPPEEALARLSYEEDRRLLREVLAS